MIVAREIQLDYGHTLPNHYSFCNQIHGHRGRVVVEFEGDVCHDTGSSSNGMVEDFKFLKNILIRTVHEKLDHGFAVWEKDVLTVAVTDGTRLTQAFISTKDFIIARN